LIFSEKINEFINLTINVNLYIIQRRKKLFQRQKRS